MIQAPHLLTIYIYLEYNNIAWALYNWIIIPNLLLLLSLLDCDYIRGKSISFPLLISFLSFCFFVFYHFFHFFFDTFYYYVGIIRPFLYQPRNLSIQYNNNNKINKWTEEKEKREEKRDKERRKQNLPVCCIYVFVG